jgi:hypothetical protein
VLRHACHHLGQREEAQRVLQETQRRFPDYLFGRIAVAEELLRNGEPGKVAELFGGKFDITQLYPTRRRFHLTEILGFQAIRALYFHALGNLDEAQRSHELMKQLDAGHRSTRLITRMLRRARFRRWLQDTLKLRWW